MARAPCKSPETPISPLCVVLPQPAHVTYPTHETKLEIVTEPFVPTAEEASPAKLVKQPLENRRRPRSPSDAPQGRVDATPLSPNPPMRSGLGVRTRGEGRGTRRSALDSDKWGWWRPLVVVGGADGGPGQRRWGGVGGTACRGRQSRTGPVRLCGSVG